MICERTAQLDIRKLSKMVQAIPEIFNYDGERIVTTWTQTNFGGRRQWFLCPSCDRRCAIIYRRGAGPLWGCRECGGGRYLSERETQWERKLRKALKIRWRLGQKNPSLMVPFPERPRGMHTATYERIRADAEQCEVEMLIEDFARFHRVSVEEMKVKLAYEMLNKPKLKA